MTPLALPVLSDGDDSLGSQASLSGLESAQPRALLPFDGELGSAECLPVLRACREALLRCAQSPDGAVLSLAGLSEDARRFLQATLGEGEVVLHVSGSHAYEARETVLPGLWQVWTREPGGALVSVTLEVGPVPHVAVAASRAGTSADLTIGEPPEGAMNVVPVLAELRHRSQAWAPGAPNHVLSFSSLPMTEADMAYLEARLGHGPVRGESRGFSRCRVELTAIRHIWSVQHFNAMGTLILDTLEVGGVPEALLACTEDFEDSALRLGEWLEGATA